MSIDLLNYVKSRLNALDFSAREKLAVKAKVGLRTIGYIRTGKTGDPRIRTLEKLASHLREEDAA